MWFKLKYSAPYLYCYVWKKQNCGSRCWRELSSILGNFHIQVIKNKSIQLGIKMSHAVLRVVIMSLTTFLTKLTCKNIQKFWQHMNIHECYYKDNFLGIIKVENLIKPAEMHLNLTRAQKKFSTANIMTK